MSQAKKISIRLSLRRTLVLSNTIEQIFDFLIFTFAFKFSLWIFSVLVQELLIPLMAKVL